MVDIKQETTLTGKVPGFDVIPLHESFSMRYLDSYPHGNMERLDYHTDSPSRVD